MKPSAEMTDAESSPHLLADDCTPIVLLGKPDTAFNAKSDLIIDGKSAMFFTFANFFNSCLTSVRTRLTFEAVSATRLVPQ